MGRVVEVVAESHWGIPPFPKHHLYLKIAGKFFDIKASMGVIRSTL